MAIIKKKNFKKQLLVVRKYNSSPRQDVKWYPSGV